MFIERTEPLITMSQFADWLYEYSANIAAIKVERENYIQYRSNIDPASDAQRFGVYDQFINLVRDEIAISLEFRKRWAACVKTNREYQPQQENSAALDQAVQAWLKKADFEIKAQSAYMLQMMIGVIAGAGLLTLASIRNPVERDDGSQENPQTLADAWFFVLFLMSNAGTPALRLNYYKKINKIINQCMGQNSDNQNLQISSIPFFEALSWSIQMYPAMNYLPYDPSNSLIKWITILLPPTGMMAGNLVGRGFDKMRTLCQWRSTTNTEQAPLLRTPDTSINNEKDNSWCPSFFKHFR